MGVGDEVAIGRSRPACAAPAAAPEPAKPLFASDQPIRITIRGPVSAIARGAEDRPRRATATLTLAGTPRAYPIRLSARGITRRRRRPAVPAAAGRLHPAARRRLRCSPGQRRLKLVTHCRRTEGFQQYLLLEYAAYRLYNLLTPISFRARLAQVDYVEPNGKVSTTRWGFFIEDLDDVARRNGMTRGAGSATAFLSTQLDPRQAAGSPCSNI